MLAVDFTTVDYLLAALAAFAAGVVNAVAGGGTLISFPALMALGASNVNANITNTVALCPGYLGGTYAQRGSLVGEAARLRVLGAAACAGGLTGSILLVTTDEELFERADSVADPDRLRTPRRAELPEEGVAASARRPTASRPNGRPWPRRAGSSSCRSTAGTSAPGSAS